MTYKYNMAETTQTIYFASSFKDGVKVTSTGGEFDADGFDFKIRKNVGGVPTIYLYVVHRETSPRTFEEYIQIQQPNKMTYSPTGRVLDSEGELIPNIRGGRKNRRTKRRHNKKRSTRRRR